MLVFGSEEAREILKLNRILTKSSAFCPACLSWPDEQRHSCTLCEGEACVKSWEVVDYLKVPYRSLQRKEYLRHLSQRGPAGEVLYAVLSKIDEEG